MTTIFRSAPILRSRAPAALRARAQPSRSGFRRSFADGRPPSSDSQVHKSMLPIVAGLTIAGFVGTWAYYAYNPEEDAKRVAETAGKTAKGVAEAQLGLKRGEEDYQKVYNKIADSLEVEGYDDGSMGPVLVRLAWHASGTYDKDSNTGGSNFATMRFEPESKHGANNGLNKARDHMQKIKEDFDWISYGDLWTLGGVAAIQEMGGPYIPWRPGRIDGYEHQATPDGRLPDASQAHDHLRQIFYRMGFNDQEIVALSGAHSLGRCHTDRSGFDGPWQFAPTSFNNEYFKLLLNEKWGWKKWAGPKQYEDVKTKSLMMLPTDMALIKDKSFRKTAKAYADDEDLFFKDFAAVFSKLIELGVPTSQWPGDPWKMKTTSDQGLE